MVTPEIMHCTLSILHDFFRLFLFFCYFGSKVCLESCRSQLLPENQAGSHCQNREARRPPQGHPGRARQHARNPEQGGQGDWHADEPGPPRGGRGAQELRRRTQGAVGLSKASIRSICRHVSITGNAGTTVGSM